MRAGFGVRQMVEVSVMSASGETQTSKTSFPLTKEGLQLALQGPIPCVKDSLPPFRAEVRTAAGALYTDSVEVTADLFLLEEYRRTKKVLSGIHLPANREARVAELSALPSADYEWVVRAVAEGDTVEASHRIRLFSLSDRRPGNKDNLWFHCGAFRPAGPSDGGQRGGQCYALLYAFL